VYVLCAFVVLMLSEVWWLFVGLEVLSFCYVFVDVCGFVVWWFLFVFAVLWVLSFCLVV
jgi:hypothetical protein